MPRIFVRQEYKNSEGQEKVTDLVERMRIKTHFRRRLVTFALSGIRSYLLFARTRDSTIYDGERFPRPTYKMRYLNRFGAWGFISES